MTDFRAIRDTRASAFDFIRLAIASPADIRGPKDRGERGRMEMAGLRTWWSWGEVTEPDTINYRSFKPARDGLFCERIFGPVRDWECSCGKYQRIRYRGVICDVCGVEVTLSKVRRERMGHIDLAMPVANMLFFGSRSCPMASLLDVTRRDLEQVIYFSNYVVIDKGHQEIENNQLLDEDEYLNLKSKAKVEGDALFLADIGAPAVRELLRRLDVDLTAQQLRAAAVLETSQHRKKMLLKRLTIVDAMRTSSDSGDVRNRPEWMVMDVILVIPPDLRPLLPLEGGRFATSDLNELYRRVIHRNNRLGRLISHRAPEVILRNEKRMLQEAVDALFDNGRRAKPIRGRGRRALKSLSDMLKGKQGRFRQNLLGKRVDYSGRTVIVPGPELLLHQCGLPKVMALELFKPFVINKLVETGIAPTSKSAKKMVERESADLYRLLEGVVSDHPVLLNRAPTLHRLGIQAFEAVLVEGKALRIHPLVCAAFNADFDGDQMAVHVPLSFEAQLEARLLMLSSNNLLSPADGAPSVLPVQDIVLGCFIATKATPRFSSESALWYCTSVADLELRMHARTGVPLQTPIMYLVEHPLGARWERTTIGRALFNAIIPAELGYRNGDMDREALSDLVRESYRRTGIASTASFLDRLMTFGFAHATRSGVSIAMDDLPAPAAKEWLIADAGARVGRFQRAYSDGNLSRAEYRDFTTQQWLDAFDAIDDEISAEMRVRDDGLGSLSVMIASGARGTRAHVRQLVGVKGFVARPQAGAPTVERMPLRPITASYREGLDPVDFFRSCHGARKAGADHVVKTASAGYLTRRLVDATLDVTITEEDCGTIMGLDVTSLMRGNVVIESLARRITGAVAAEDVEHPSDIDETGRLVLLEEAGVVIDEESARRIEERGVRTVKIRSVLTCEAARGLCRTCYGGSLSTMRMVEIGDAVGIIAAQSAGEPATQKLLDAKHLGGVADLLRAESGADAQVTSDVDGIVRLVEVIEDLSFVTHTDAGTGRVVRVITRKRRTDLDPRVEIIERNPRRDRIMRSFVLPDGFQLLAIDGAEVRASAVLAFNPADRLALRDMGDGLARLEDLFEARAPDNAAVLSEVDGRVRVGGIHRYMREVFVTADVPGAHGEDAEVMLYEIAPGARLVVQDGDDVGAGDRLSEGPISPHDLLRIRGPHAVQSYLVDRLHLVYHANGARVHDKHLGIIVRQMLHKVRVTDAGDTDFREGELVDKTIFRDANRRMRMRKEEPATATHMLMGVKKVAQSTESFIAAASFEKTIDVLADAAIRGATDILLGLKENVITGHLIPAGTGVYRYQDVELG